MNEQLWSWLLAIVGITGFILAGRKVWWAWWVNLACQGLWFAYGYIFGQWGFVAASIAYTVVFAKNAISWTREHFKEQDELVENVQFDRSLMSINEVRALKGYAEADVNLTMELMKPFEGPSPYVDMPSKTPIERFDEIWDGPGEPLEGAFFVTFQELVRGFVAEELIEHMKKRSNERGVDLLIEEYRGTDVLGLRVSWKPWVLDDRAYCEYGGFSTADCWLVAGCGCKVVTTEEPNGE